MFNVIGVLSCFMMLISCDLRVVMVLVVVVLVLMIVSL